MGARSKIIDLNRSTAEIEPAEDFAIIGSSASNAEERSDYQDLADHQDLVHESQNQLWADEEVAPARNWAAISAMALLIVAFMAWTGFFIWAHLAEFSSDVRATRISELIVSWAVPTCLIALGWLLAMRVSSREATRFGDVARLLRDESLSLEDRMRRVNGEISLARSFLAENARELDSVGRASAQRLTDAAGILSTALTESDERAQMLQVASNAAVTNLEQLRNHLPVVTSAAKDATNQIGIAGNTAHSQIQAILATLNRVTEASEKTGEDLGKLDAQLAQSASELEERVSASAEKLGVAVVNSRDAAMPMFADFERHIADIEKRIGEASATTHAQLENNEERLTAILASLQANVEALQTTFGAHDEAAQESIVRMSGFIEETRNSLSTIDKDATDRIVQLAFAVNALVETNGELTSKLADNREQTKDFMAESANLLDMLRQVETEAATKLPEAFAGLQTKFDESRSALRDVATAVDATDRRCTEMTGSIAQIDKLIADQTSLVEQLSQTTGAQVEGQRERIEALSSALSVVRDQIEEMVEHANEKLVASMQRVRETTRDAADASRKIIDEELAEISGSISERNGLALKAAVEDQIGSLDIAMHEALQRNLSLAEEIEKRAASQLERLDEMATNLEQRIAQAQTGFAGIDDEGFARRMALLTESLNSAAIDVAKILSNDVTDTAWAAYLKGDRGVFTRRAVRLLDSAEVKMIAANYDEDTEFRDNVNRYIHDFEAMMRVLLSTRDGNAIGVTLLSSDVGKLYVALAQAIERLRH